MHFGPLFCFIKSNRQNYSKMVYLILSDLWWNKNLPRSANGTIQIYKTMADVYDKVETFLIYTFSRYEYDKKQPSAKTQTTVQNWNSWYATKCVNDANRIYVRQPVIWPAGWMHFFVNYLSPSIMRDFWTARHTKPHRQSNKSNHPLSTCVCVCRNASGPANASGLAASKFIDCLYYSRYTPDQSDEYCHCITRPYKIQLI